MADTTREEIDKIIADPESHFDHPDQVVADDGLTREQKITILRSWATDERLLQTASSENMGGGEAPHLDDVMKALRDLGAEPTD